MYAPAHIVLERITMKQDTKPRDKPSSEAAREAAAEQLKQSEETAKEVAELCELAADRARQHKLPHAGVGGGESDRQA
jgi:hypothetical protein